MQGCGYRKVRWGPLPSNVKGPRQQVARCFELQDSCLLAALTHHRPRMLPFCQLVQDPKQINTGKEVPPAKLVIVTCFLQGKPRNNHLLHSCRCSSFQGPPICDVSTAQSLHTCTGNPLLPSAQGDVHPRSWQRVRGAP